MARAPKVMGDQLAEVSCPYCISGTGARVQRRWSMSLFVGSALYSMSASVAINPSGNGFDRRVPAVFVIISDRIRAWQGAATIYSGKSMIVYLI